MTTSSNNNRSRFSQALNLICLLTLALAFIGCSSTGVQRRAYLGPTRSTNEIAVLHVQSQFLGARAIVRQVDGITLATGSQRNNTKVIELLPGRHGLSVDYLSGNEEAVDALFLEFVVKAGGVYQLHTAAMRRGFMDELRDALSGRGYWTAWIVDANTGEVIAGRPWERAPRVEGKGEGNRR